MLHSKTGLVLFLVCLFAALTIRAVQCTPYAFNDTVPLSTYKSRPDIFAPFLNMTLYDETLATPGYIFLEPYETTQPGPYLYDNAGNLVWSGFQSAGPGPAHNFHVCPYSGSDHLCFFTGQQYAGYARGFGLILDNTLNVVKSVQSQGGLSPLDQHEFHVVDDGKSALITVYQVQQADLSNEGVGSGVGWITNCWFQEIALDTNKLLFEWSALDHVSPIYSTVAPSSSGTSGTGLDPTAPWDYFHINSVDKDAAGDYLISSRHTSTLYKISGTNGTILWRLSGTNGSTSFSLGLGLNFSYQHDARIRFQNSTTTILTLFDNAADGSHPQSAPSSSGLLIAIDHRTYTANQLQRYLLSDTLVSTSQGNLQLLHPDSWQTSNVYIGWGQNAYISEYTSNGTMVQQGHFSTAGAMHYRSRKANITIHPTDAPALYTYALNSSSPTQYYVSWNGATEVRGWRIYSVTGSSSSNPQFKVLATVAKNGFETVYTASDYHRWSIVEALDMGGKGIRNSSRVIRTFVPGGQLAKMCDEIGCAAATNYSSQPIVASLMYGDTFASIPAGNKESSVAAATAGASARGGAMRRAPGRPSIIGVAALGLAGMLM